MLRVRAWPDLVEAVRRLEVTDVLSDGLEVRLLVLALEHVVGALALVGRDEVGVVDGRERHHVRHVRPQLLLQPPVEHLSG